jgi:ribosomal protein S18 acetylase RimI-like enzyme
MVHIRKMIPEDRSVVYEMLMQTDMFTMAEVNVAVELIDIYLFNKDQQDYDVYVAEFNEQVIGYICFGPTPATEATFDLYWIVVSPEMQSKGFGSQLLKFVEKEVMRQKGKLLIIETSSQHKYIPTQNFYKSRSYKLEARIKDFYRAGDDRLIFVKRFNNPVHGESKKNGTLEEAVAK